MKHVSCSSVAINGISAADRTCRGPILRSRVRPSSAEFGKLVQNVIRILVSASRARLADPCIVMAGRVNLDTVRPGQA